MWKQVIWPAGKDYSKEVGKWWGMSAADKDKPVNRDMIARFFRDHKGLTETRGNWGRLNQRVYDWDIVALMYNPEPEKNEYGEVAP